MHKINVAQIIKETEAEGPGKRYALWVQGCPLLCSGCCNPEMLPFKARRMMSVETLVEDATKCNIEGVSLLGGEPFSQPEAVSKFVEQIKSKNLSVMIFSGYTLEELHLMNNEFVEQILNNTDVLVDGRYEKDKRTTSKRWVGSTNQKIHFLTERYKNDPRFDQDNSFELRFNPKDKLIIVNGFPVQNSKRLF